MSDGDNDIPLRRPLLSIIKIEPEKFDISTGNEIWSSTDEVLRRKANIFSDPEVRLERISSKFQPPRILQKKNGQASTSNATVLLLAKEGNAGRKYSDSHTCCLCKKVLSARKKLISHLKTVHDKAPATYFCDLCPKSFSVRCNMYEHMKNHAKTAFSCNVCDFKTPHKKILVLHKMTHSMTERCKICNKQVASMKLHLVYHKKEPCPKCNRMIASSRLKPHIRTHEETLKCSECERTFSNKTYLRRHKLEEHYEGKVHKCHCGAIFKSLKSFQTHRRLHKHENVSCPACQQMFLSRLCLTSHWRRKHFSTHGKLATMSKTINIIINRGPFICDQCGSTFKDRKSFSNHFRQQHLTKPSYFCDLCPKSYAYKSFLRIHVEMGHLKYGSFCCRVCDHKSRTKQNLEKHMLRHRAKTKCTVCHKMLVNINSHMRTHIEVKCQICSQSYSKATINLHLRTHRKLAFVKN